MQASIVKKNLKAIAFFIGLFILGSNVQAQHCEDGCNVNINGPQTVKVGVPVTYYVTPNVPGVRRYTPIWDQVGFLDNKATIDAEGIDADGNQYITVTFTVAGDTWLTYVDDYYGGGEDYDEMVITMEP